MLSQYPRPSAGSSESGTAATSQSVMDVSLDLDYFRKQGLMPLNEMALGGREVSDANWYWPPFDFDTNYVSDIATVLADGVRLYKTSGTPGAMGYDLGALRDRALVVLGGVDLMQVDHFIGLFVAADLPPDNVGGGGYPDGVPTDAYFALRKSTENSGLTIQKTDGSGTFTELDDDDDGHSDTWLLAGGGVFQIIGLAIYFDGATGTISLFVRHAVGTWALLITVVDPDIAQIRYIGLYEDAIGVGGSPFKRFMGPFRAFYE